MDTLVLVLWLLFLFVGLPLAVGAAVGRRRAASVLWVVLAGLMAVSQSRDDELGGLWVAVVIVAALGLPLVLAGVQLRTRRASGHGSV